MDLKITNLLGEADWKKVARHMESWAHFSREDLSTTQVYYFTALHFLNKTFYADFYIIFAMLQLHLTTNLSFEHWIQVMCSAAKNLVLSQIVLLGLSISALLSSIEVVIKYCTFWAQTYQLETLTFVSWTFQIWSLIMIFRMILMFITIQNQKKKTTSYLHMQASWRLPFMSWFATNFAAMYKEPKQPISCGWVAWNAVTNYLQ